jgi:hydrogenase expression/formation protein HypC
MCLAIPAEVVELLADGHARVDAGGVQKNISVALIEELKIGDYVLVHVGHALSKIDAEEARKTLALFKEMLAAENHDANSDSGSDFA